MNAPSPGPLYAPLKFDDLSFKNRIVMPPMTRCRAAQPGNVPTSLMAEYYSRHCDAGLIIAEATQVSPDAQGYSFTPGIHSQEQIAGWKQVTQAVHRKGGQIFLQIWHTGRMSHASFHDGAAPFAPSAIETPEGTGVWIANANGEGGAMQRCTPPRAMTLAEIRRVQDDFVQATANAREAGFDGVELHGANGYLIDEFLRKSSNHRDDAYGGSPHNRIRFLIEILERLVTIFPPSRIGVRFAPHNQTRGMDDPDTPETVLLAMTRMAALDIGYVHFAEVDWDAEPNVPEEFRALARALFPNLILVAGNYTKERAQWVLEKNYADMVAFGRLFLANPDLPRRLRDDLPLNALQPDFLFGGGAQGYVDYPRLEEA
ncbi:alkene reductase [Novosphingobium sp. 1949]|uniref:Alkene reductase n=1 Tax=Novosphingobium organovorum TaxID=2930092 RepID=A0ABT0BBW6_9SPHN|nr:alkene reductase [Novosphingobium organovorum]MCJ2182539.1 alkene reductase [Novosphingobium organovorum]